MLSPSEIAAVCDRVDLRQLAVDLGASFRGKARYGRCPICGGGKSAARFEIKPDGRAWVCAVCEDGGDAIKLVMRVKGIKFREAVETLGGPVVLSESERAKLDAKIKAERAKRDEDADAYRERERRALYAVWRAAAPLIGSPAEAYLRGRGITWRLDELDLRCADRPYFEGLVSDERGHKVPRLIVTGPAMLAAFVGADGRFRGLHQTWIDTARPGVKADIFDPETGEALPAKKMRGHKAGGYLRLTRSGDLTRLYCGEGIETTLSVREHMRDGFAYRAAGDLGNVAGKAATRIAHPTLKTLAGRAQSVGTADPDFDSEAMPVPPETRELILLKDGDSDAFTTDLAMRRAGARHARRGLVIRCADPGAGRDFNDIARGAA